MANNGLIASKCKVYKKSMLIKNLETLMTEQDLSIQELAQKADISRQGLYNIIKGSKPHKNTIQILADTLGVSEEKLQYGTRHYDYEHFIKMLNLKFPERINQKDLLKFMKNSGYETTEDIDLENFLISHFNIDPKDMFIKHILPAKEIRKEIANYFGYDPKDIFKIYGSIPLGDDYPSIKHIPVIGIKELDKHEFYKVFNKLNQRNKKIVFNLCQDLLQGQG